MVERMILSLQILTYIALLPLVQHALMCVDFSKIFKKEHVGQIRLLYLFVAIVIVKIVGDFIITIMMTTLTITGIYN